MIKSTFLVFLRLQSYKDAIQTAGMGGRMHIFYAVKANSNLHLMELVRKRDCGAVTVSGYELQAALNTGFPPEMILLNGNGKQMCQHFFSYLYNKALILIILLIACIGGRSPWQ